jgi:hypothetical protein
MINGQGQKLIARSRYLKATPTRVHINFTLRMRLLVPHAFEKK